jgi:hypothetical protein
MDVRDPAFIPSTRAAVASESHRLADSVSSRSETSGPRPKIKMSAPTMQPFRLRSFLLRRRFVWLLWLGLLVPVAQAAAMCHALTHVRGEIDGRSDDKSALHASHCDLCLAAAAIAGGGPTSEAPTFRAPAIRHEAPSVTGVGVWLALPVRAYRSRAPPFASL